MNLPLGQCMPSLKSFHTQYPSHYTPILSLHHDSGAPPLQGLRMSYLSCSIIVKIGPGQLVAYKYQ